MTYGALIFTFSNGKQNQLIDEVHYGYRDTNGNMEKAEIEYYADDGVTQILSKLECVDTWLEENNYKLQSTRFEEIA